MRYNPNVTYTPAEILDLICLFETEADVILVWNEVVDDKFLYCLDDLKLLRWAIDTRLKEISRKDFMDIFK